MLNGPVGVAFHLRLSDLTIGCAINADSIGRARGGAGRAVFKGVHTPKLIEKKFHGTEIIMGLKYLCFRHKMCNRNWRVYSRKISFRSPRSQKYQVLKHCGVRVTLYLWQDAPWTQWVGGALPSTWKGD